MTFSPPSLRAICFDFEASFAHIISTIVIRTAGDHPSSGKPLLSTITAIGEQAMRDLILALDQGTTSSRAIVFDHSGTPLAAQQIELPQHFPQPGWVEHDPEVIWQTQLRAAHQVLATVDAATRIAAVGITNQ